MSEPTVPSRQKPIVTESGSDSNEEERHKVVKSSSKPRFKVGHTVWIKGEDGSAQEGPYKVERVLPRSNTSWYRYTLCDVSTSIRVRDGESFAEAQLVRGT